jgi:hypothetical protein
MAKKPGYKHIGEQLSRGDVGERHGAGEIEALRQRFLQFRREHRSRTRIPEVLRDAALATIQRGISADEVRRACRISEGQLIRWIERRGAFAQKPAEEEDEGVRVFPVVEDNVGNTGLHVGAPEGSALHLRVGGWDICIRQNER